MVKEIEAGRHIDIVIIGHLRLLANSKFGRRLLSEEITGLLAIRIELTDVMIV